MQDIDQSTKQLRFRLDVEPATQREQFGICREGKTGQCQLTAKQLFSLVLICLLNDVSSSRLQPGLVGIIVPATELRAVCPLVVTPLSLNG